jgi:hypothetical protein
MTESQTGSIVITILAALIVLMLFFWATEFKPMLAVIAVFPIVLVLLWVLGSMTLLGIPYNVVTALITALSIGIGVDYTIHVIHRFTEELEHLGSVEAATTKTLATTGSALLGSALTTALGFGVLLFSPLIPFRQFGLVTGITILYALIVAVAVVPPLLVIWAAYHQWRTRETAEVPVLVGAGEAGEADPADALPPEPIPQDVRPQELAADISDGDEEPQADQDSADIEQSRPEDDGTESPVELVNEEGDDSGDDERTEG